MHNNTQVVREVNTKVVWQPNTFVLDLPNMNPQYGQRLKAARTYKKWSQEELAEKSGVKQGTISKIERGDQAASTYDIELSYALDVHPLWLKNGDERFLPIFLGGDYIESYVIRKQLLDLSEPEKMAAYKTEKNYPRVVGTARCGDHGYYLDLDGGDGYIEFEAEIGSVAIRIKGHSMHPAIREGWYVVIEPNKRPDIGEYVLVKFKDGKKMVKELLQIKHDGYLLLSVNGDERITAQFDELEGIQAISAIVPPSKHKEW